jgi:multisubunit Na+/H+ antiporter MnhB subunit
MTVHRHPVLGFFAGLLLGLGVVLLLFVFGVLPVTFVWFGVALIVGALVGVLVAYLAPARHRAATG